MGRLIKAEFRKILTTKLWWALMIPTALLALGMAGVLTSVVSSAVDALDASELRRFNVRFDDLSWSSVFLTRGINIATIMPMVFGGLAIAGELSNKTITTSFLTAPNRPLLLTAKALTYAIWGLIYGVVIVVSATLGVLIGGAGVAFDVWLPIAATGLLASMLWTLLGLGVGALIGTPVLTTVILLVYGLIVGPIGDLALTGAADGFETLEPNMAGALPNGAANGLTGSTAADTLSAEVQSLGGNVPVPQSVIDTFEAGVQYAAGGLGSFGLLASLGIFLGWTVLFFGLGLFRTQTRDIT